MLLVLGVLVLMLNYATAMRLVRHVKGDDFVFVEKFCFNDDGPGHIQGSGLTYSDRPVKFALFTDEKGGWNDITTRTTCEDKLNRAKTVVDIDHGVLFKMDVKVIDTDGPHFWYLAIVNCHSTVDIELDLEFINSGSGCFKQFSNDEKGLMFVYFIMFAGSGVLFYFQLKSVQDMMERKSLHPIVQIVALGVSMLLFSLLLHSTHYLVFAIDGRGLNLMESLAEFVYVLFQVVFITTIIMLAKGWTISSIELTERRNMAIALGVYTLMHIFLFVWTSHQQHKASTVYKYGTGPGVGIVLMRTCIWLWFLLCLRDTVTQEYDPIKRQLYFALGGLFSFWLLSLAVIVLIAGSVTPCSRKALVTSMLLVADITNLGALSFLLWPSRANQYFNIEISDKYSGIRKRDDL